MSCSRPEEFTSSIQSGVKLTPDWMLLVNSIRLLVKPFAQSRPLRPSDASSHAAFRAARGRRARCSRRPRSPDAAIASSLARHSAPAAIRPRARPETGCPPRPPAGRRSSGTPPFSLVAGLVVRLPVGGWVLRRSVRRPATDRVPGPRTGQAAPGFRSNRICTWSCPCAFCPSTHETLIAPCGHGAVRFSQSMVKAATPKAPVVLLCPLGSGRTGPTNCTPCSL
jgi:hypothetical protein